MPAPKVLHSAERLVLALTLLSKDSPIEWDHFINKSPSIRSSSKPSRRDIIRQLDPVLASGLSVQTSVPDLISVCKFAGMRVSGRRQPIGCAYVRARSGDDGRSGGMENLSPGCLYVIVIHGPQG